MKKSLVLATLLAAAALAACGKKEEPVAAPAPAPVEAPAAAPAADASAPVDAAKAAADAAATAATGAQTLWMLLLLQPPTPLLLPSKARNDFRGFQLCWSV